MTPATSFPLVVIIILLIWLICLIFEFFLCKNLISSYMHLLRSHLQTSFPYFIFRQISYHRISTAHLSSINSLPLFSGDEFGEIFWGPTGYGSCLTLKKTLALDGNAHYLWEMVDCSGSFNVLCQIGKFQWILRCIYMGRSGFWSSGTQLWSAQICAPVYSGFNILI